MALFGSNWSDIFGDNWSDDYDNIYKPKPTTKQILDEIDIKEIENYLREKKLEQLKKKT